MSFGWLGIFREGSWKAFRSFVLHEKRDASRRVRVIDAELERIGQVIILFGTETSDTNETTSTEQRLGFTVSPSSTLEKLMQAYIAVGGNPMDISMFLQPDRTLVLSDGATTEISETNPHGGYVSPRSVDFAQLGAFDGGFLPVNKYLPNRLGGRQVVWDKAHGIGMAVDWSRRWVTQEIRHKRNNIEARIIKQMDLREQLILEKEEVIEQAVGGTVSGIAFRNQYHSRTHRIQNIINTFDLAFWATDAEGRIDFDLPSARSRVTGRYQTLLDDVVNGEEDWTAL